jgi:hypothetical protein
MENLCISVKNSRPVWIVLIRQKSYPLFNLFLQKEIVGISTYTQALLLLLFYKNIKKGELIP